MSRITLERGISYDQLRENYYVYMDYGRDESGRRVRRYQTYATLLQARQGLRAFLAQRESSRAVAPNSMTLDEWLEYWMEQVIVPSRAETTAYSYRKIIENHLSPALGAVPIQRLTPQRLQSYYTFLLQEKKLSPNTIRRHHDLLSAALHTAQRQDILLRSPTDRVDPPKVVHRETRFYSPEELKTLYALCRDTPLELPVRLAGGLGLRREELCGLRWNCVDFSLRRVHIRSARTAAGAAIVYKETKNRSSNRVLYIEDELLALLRREWERHRQRTAGTWEPLRDDSLVLVDRRGLPWSPNALSLAFTRFIRRHGLPKITLHGLRHTFATVASAQGAPLFDIGKALGHSSPATTGRIYTHLLDQTHQAILTRVADAVR